MEHADYPHWPGTLYDCPACEEVMEEEAENISTEGMGEYPW